MVKYVTAPSLANRVPIGLSKIGELFGGTGVGVGEGTKLLVRMAEDESERLD